MTNRYYDYRERGKCNMCEDILWSWANQIVYCKCGMSNINNTVISMNISAITDADMEAYIRNSETFVEGEIVVMTQI